MSLGQYLRDRLGGMQLDCPVLPLPACAQARAGDEGATPPQAPDPVTVTDELAAVAVLSNN